MKTPDYIISQLKQEGMRMTKTRSFIISIFQKNHLPLTEAEIRQALGKKGRVVNKTTVYRELESLKAKGVIREVEFGDGKKRYELDLGSHHHHLICISCRTVDEIHVEDDVSHIEKTINKKNNFKITSHSLEFFGLCKNCK